MQVLRDGCVSFTVIWHITPQVEVIKKAYLQGEVEFEDTKKEEDNGDEEEHDAASPRNVGHNIYILAHQVYCSTLGHVYVDINLDIIQFYQIIDSCKLNSSLFVSSRQLARHNKELSMMLKPGGGSGEGDEALECYAKHTAQIEVTTHNLELKMS